MELQSFNAIYARANLLYDIEMQPVDFEEMALSGFEKIGNFRYRIYHACLNLQQDEYGWFVELPCNCDPERLIAVTLTWGENWKYTSSLTINGDWDSHYVENYIEGRKTNKSMFYEQGIFAKYTVAGDKLYFNQNYGKVHVLYKGVLCNDEDGLPLVTEKEVEALAAYIAYITKQKAAWRINDINSLRMSEIAKADWMRLCAQARVPKSISQNDMDRILDAATSFNRKHFNWSLKPSK